MKVNNNTHNIKLIEYKPGARWSSKGEKEMSLMEDMVLLGEREGEEKFFSMSDKIRDQKMFHDMKEGAKTLKTSSEEIIADDLLAEGVLTGKGVLEGKGKKAGGKRLTPEEKEIVKYFLFKSLSAKKRVYGKKINSASNRNIQKNKGFTDGNKAEMKKLLFQRYIAARGKRPVHSQTSKQSHLAGGVYMAGNMTPSKYTIKRRATPYTPPQIRMRSPRISAMRMSGGARRGIPAVKQYGSDVSLAREAIMLGDEQGFQYALEYGDMYEMEDAFFEGDFVDGLEDCFVGDFDDLDNAFFEGDYGGFWGEVFDDEDFGDPFGGDYDDYLEAMDDMDMGMMDDMDMME